LYVEYANFTDHYQCHDLLVAHPEVEELIYTIGDRCLFAINTDPLVKEKVRPYLKLGNQIGNQLGFCEIKRI
jgi:hypothetical protein